MLIEAMIAATIVAIVMAALTTLLVHVTRSTALQRDTQAATQLAVASLDTAIVLGRGVSQGRDGPSVDAQWSSPLAHDPAVAPLLATMVPLVDAAAPAATGTDPERAALPTVPVRHEIGPRHFDVSYFVGTCTLTSGACGTPAGGVEYVRIVGVVTWTGSGCPDTGCVSTSAILVNRLPDPVFNTEQDPPPPLHITPVGAQSSLAGRQVAGLPNPPEGCATPCPVTARGGVAPVVFSATVTAIGAAQPAAGSCDATGTGAGRPIGGAGQSAYGFALDPVTGLVTGAPQTVGAYCFEVSAVDAFRTVDRVRFRWDVTDAAACTGYRNLTVNRYSASDPTWGGPQPGTQTYSWSGAPGLAVTFDFDTGSYTLTPTATACPGGPYTYTVSALSYSKPGDSQPTQVAQPGISCPGQGVNVCVDPDGTARLYTPDVATYHIVITVTPASGAAVDVPFDWTFEAAR